MNIPNSKPMNINLDDEDQLKTAYEARAFLMQHISEGIKIVDHLTDAIADYERATLATMSIAERLQALGITDGEA